MTALCCVLPRPALRGLLTRSCRRLGNDHGAGCAKGLNLAHCTGHAERYNVHEAAPARLLVSCVKAPSALYVNIVSTPFLAVESTDPSRCHEECRVAARDKGGS